MKGIFTFSSMTQALVWMLWWTSLQSLVVTSMQLRSKSAVSPSSPALMDTTDFTQPTATGIIYQQSPSPASVIGHSGTTKEQRDKVRALTDELHAALNLPASSPDEDDVTLVIKKKKCCGTHDRGADCVTSDWSAFSPCTLSCGPGGVSTRSRTIVTPAGKDGRPCGTLKEVITCPDIPCPVDCKMTGWSSYSRFVSIKAGRKAVLNT